MLRRQPSRSAHEWEVDTACLLPRGRPSPRTPLAYPVLLCLPAARRVSPPMASTRPPTWLALLPALSFKWPPVTRKANGEVGDAETPPGYLPHLDGLRAVALFFVLLYHFELGPSGGGFSGVDIFSSCQAISSPATSWSS